jgi:hypothetical protein
MVYTLANAGINVNMKNIKGNTALHTAYMRGYVEIGFSFFEALFKVGIDPTIKNNNGKYASYYMEDIEQLNVIYRSHYPGILAAFVKQNVEDVSKLVNGKQKYMYYISRYISLLFFL